MATLLGNKALKGNIMATLAEIRAKLQQQDNRTGNSGTSGGDRAIYAHWNIPEGSTAKLRFLPDGNSKNDFFWVERSMIKLPFQGIKGQMDSKPVMVQVPCVEMYNDGTACPVLAEVRTWFKDPSLEELGRKYWKKRSYIFQGFVHDSPMAEEETPENPIRRFIISPQIFNVVKAALMDTEIEELPTDFDRGLDFQVTKTSKGGYADYSTSKWARKETALTSAELAAIEQYGLFELAEFLPKKPSETELKVIQEMFEASVDGQPYDVDRFGQYFKPSGVNIESTANSAANSAPKAKSVAAPKVDEDDEIPFKGNAKEEMDAPAASAPIRTPASETSSKTADILAAIRQRKTAE